MVPPKTDKRWEMLITGKIKQSFKSFPLSMMLTRHKRELMKDGSRENIDRHIEEAYNFFVKFEKILEEDIKTIFS